jgi:hypothetical protein
MLLTFGGWARSDRKNITRLLLNIDTQSLGAPLLTLLEKRLAELVA